MPSRPSARTIGTVALTLLSALAVFHLLVLAGIVPPIVWGGHATSRTAVVMGELISLVLTVLFMGIVSIRAGLLWPGRFRYAAAIGIWCPAVVFALSTIGNLTYAVTTEKLFFAPVSFVLTALAVRLGVVRHHQ